MERALASLCIPVAGIVVALAIPASRASAQERGWQPYDLGDGRRATRFVPSTVRFCDPLPVALFLHGAGGTPEAYHSHLAAHAEELGLVLVLPQASGAGWSSTDTVTIEAALGALEAEGIVIDPQRTYLAGHSAGGAFAYLLAYSGATGFASVFTMSAPYYEVAALSDPMHDAPIRMYYGADDPNFTGGGATMLDAQWERLGLVHELDVQVGFGHSTWPPSSVRAGLEFLLAHPYAGAPTPSSCADADGGAGDDDAGARLDAGPIDRDAAIALRDAEADGGPDAGAIVGPPAEGCSCRAGTRSSHGGIGLVALLALALISVERRRR